MLRDTAWRGRLRLQGWRLAEGQRRTLIATLQRLVEEAEAHRVEEAQRWLTEALAELDQLRKSQR